MLGPKLPPNPSKKMGGTDNFALNRRTWPGKQNNYYQINKTKSGFTRKQISLGVFLFARKHS